MKPKTPRGEHSATPLADAIRKIPNAKPEPPTCRHGRSLNRRCSMCERFNKP